MKENIYNRDSLNKGEYSWNERSRRHIRLYRYMNLGLGIFIKGAVIYYLYLFLRNLNDRPVNFIGTLIILFSALILNIGTKAGITQLFSKMCRNMEPEEGHDFLLYLYYHSYKKNKKAKSITLLAMAKDDIISGKYSQAKSALQEADTEVFNAVQLKMYYLMWTVLEILDQTADEDEHSNNIRDWYIRYISIEPKSEISFPKDETLYRWIEKGADRTEIYSSLSEIYRNRKYRPFKVFALTAMITECVFFWATYGFLNAGWHLRMEYEIIMSALTSVFIIILSVAFLKSFISWKKKQYSLVSRSAKIKTIIASACWIIFSVLISVIIILNAVLNTADYTEKTIAENVEDGITGRKYNYLAVYEPYSDYSRYYRTDSIIFMEEWDEAEEYDKSRSDSSDSENYGSTEENQDSATETENTADENNDEDIIETEENNSIKESMTSVFQHIKSEKTVPAESIEFSADAKGNIYAVIYQAQDNSGKEYQYRLYSNGIKTDHDSIEKEEIVLEKVYINGESSTEIVDFYTVNLKTGEVADEHRTTWQ